MWKFAALAMTLEVVVFAAASYEKKWIVEWAEEDF